MLPLQRWTTGLAMPVSRPISTDCSFIPGDARQLKSSSRLIHVLGGSPFSTIHRQFLRRSREDLHSRECFFRMTSIRAYLPCRRNSCFPILVRRLLLPMLYSAQVG